MSQQQPAQRLKDIQPFRVMALLARARNMEAAGADIVHMEIGEPDFATPAGVIDSVQQQIKKGEVHYTPATGMPALRHAISDFYQTRYQCRVDAERILITPGASGALHLVLASILNPGQSVLMADPGYPCNRNFVRLLEGKTQLIAVDEKTEYQLTYELVKTNWQTDSCAVLIASPSNPTGTLIKQDELKAIIQFVEEQGGYVIVDEIYHGLIYDKPDYQSTENTALAYSHHLFVVNSFSKYFGLTGWRVGWVVAPVNMVSELDKLAQNLYLAAPTPGQYAALASFNKHNIEELDERRDAYQQRRDYLLPALRDLGFEIPVQPQGAFYLYANIKKFSSNSLEFSEAMLAKAKVAITPGVDFGKYQANMYCRFAYTTSLERLKEGVRRLKEYLP
jgi:aspartate/methionine/tyrosine aminotransferase